MSKVMLIIDNPEACIDCPCHFIDETLDKIFWCGKENKEMETNDIETYKPKWCPLKEVPHYKKTIGTGNEDYKLLMNVGWNDCIDEILKDKEAKQ